MRHLFVNKLQYIIKCADDSTYGARVEFKRGLNIIYGPNSVGKSSIITGIFYGLGAEKVLGIFGNRDNPFKPEFYREIEGRKIVESYLLLEIANSSETITIKRNIIGKTNICTIKKCELEQFNLLTESLNYILDNGTMEEHGFQKYLFEFLKWDITKVLTYDGNNTNIYFENLVPLFFVEQKAGWSKIQARQITRYGIRDVKKIVFEYLFGLKKFDLHLLKLKKIEINTDIRNLEKELEFKTNYILSLGNATVSNDKLIINKIGFGAYEINELISILENTLKEKEDIIKQIYDEKDAFDSFANSKRDKLREYLNTKHLLLEKSKQLTNEINSYNNYIAKIEMNKKKNRQLEKIEKINLDLNITTCPICDSKIDISDGNHCNLCKSDTTNISTASENLLFLEDEKSSFIKILKNRELELEKTNQSIKDVKSKEEHLTKMLDYQMKTYLGQEIQKLRDLVREIDSIYSEILKYKDLFTQWEGLNPLTNGIDKLNSEKKQIEEKIKEYQKSSTDEQILEMIRSYFISNSKALHLFTANNSFADRIKLEESDGYTPSLEIYDLNNISSSSDYIRIILSYYLALLQTSVELSEINRIKYPNVLIFDEPKQQNLDNIDIENLIKTIEKIPDSDEWQIILTTYNPNEKQLFEKYIQYEMKHKNDFLLKRIN